jgi:peroxiredoxin
MVLERFIVAAVVLAGAGGIGLLIPWIISKRLRSIVVPVIPRDSTIEQHPVILYFYTDECAQCKPQQNYLEEAALLLKQAGQAMYIRKYHALQEKELVKQFHILTVPTTIVLDADDNVRAWNAGLTDALQLVHQYQKSLIHNS